MSHIKFATPDDIDETMLFIHKYWENNHILSQNRELFLYEYLDGDRLNFVISKNKDGDINAILGFIRSSTKTKDIWAAMWKVSKSDNPMLGIQLLEFLRSSTEYGVLTCNGISIDTVGIYNYLDIYTGTLDQYVLVNNNITDYKIAKVPDEKPIEKKYVDVNSSYSLKKLSKETIDFDFEQHKENIPYKDRAYFIKRFFEHPIYHYDVYGIQKYDKISVLLATRVVQVGGAKALRIVDYYGDENDLLYVAKYLYAMMVEQEYEYIDFLCFGFNEKSLYDVGYIKVDFDSDELNVPNYFSPFIQKNIKIHFFADTEEIAKIRMCKADGDQDRPS